MGVLELTVVADRHGSTSRAYLTYLAAAGYRVRRVLLVDFHGPQERLLRRRRRFGARLASWRLQREPATEVDFGPDFRDLCRLLQASTPCRIDYFEDFDFAAHCEELDRFVTTEYDDPAFQRRLLAQPCRTYLYTSGGRVPPAFLRHDGVRMLHIHPGVVPWVRGSDGVLWSILVRGRPGASCFYMNEGLDTGEIIHTREFDRPVLSGIESYLASDEDLVYRALLHAYDPHLRAQVLLDVVQQAAGGDLGGLPGRPQRSGEGRDYYWMHPRLRHRVFEELMT
ncbi:MAG: formyltransferase family protein [Planctomycetota bacterium]|jgi:hypothetical protein